MDSTKRQRQRERRAIGHTKQASGLAKGTVPATRVNRLCERCGAGCRTAKPAYGWVCANCAYELDRYFIFHLGLTGGSIIEVYESAKRRGELPPPSPRGHGVNIRKP